MKTGVAYLLDTNIVSRLMHELETQPAGPCWTRFNACRSQGIAISVIVAGELQLGLCHRPSAKREAMHRCVLGRLSEEALPLEAAVLTPFAETGARLQREGRALHKIDMLIAAHSIALNATLVSDDRAFQRVPGLKLENWLHPPPAAAQPATANRAWPSAKLRSF